MELTCEDKLLPALYTTQTVLKILKKILWRVTWQCIHTITTCLCSFYSILYYSTLCCKKSIPPNQQW